jgi:cytochrome c556
MRDVAERIQIGDFSCSLNCHAALLESKFKRKSGSKLRALQTLARGLVPWTRDHVGTFRRTRGLRYVMLPCTTPNTPRHSGSVPHSTSSVTANATNLAKRLECAKLASAFPHPAAKIGSRKGGDPPKRQDGPSSIIKVVKHHTLILAILSSAIFVVGCSKESTTSEQLDQAQTKTSKAAQDMKNYSYAQKAQFVEKMQSELTALNAELDQLSAKIEKSSDAAKAEAKPKLQALRDQTAQMNKQFDEVKSATESTWDSVKEGFNKAYQSSKDGVQQARQWASNKIAP